MTSIYSVEYRRAIDLLVQARKDAGVTQQDLAKALARPQSFVSKFENGDRRLDVVEYIQICRLVGADPITLLKALVDKKVKGDEDRRRRLGDQRSEIGNAILGLHDRLAVEDCRSAGEPRSGGGDLGKTLRPVVAVPRKQTRSSSLQDQLDTIPILLDLVNPMLQESATATTPRER